MGSADEEPTGRRPAGRRALHAVRRVHLYLGLFLFPWAILYGVTSYLFNHPAAFADQPTAHYGPAATAGTPLDSAPTPDAVAAEVVAKLNEVQQPATPYRVAGPARYAREFAFATVKADGQTVSILYDVKNGGGTVRAAPAVEKPPPEKPPFVTAGAPMTPKGGGREPRAATGGVKLPDQLHERFKAAIPTILDRTGFPGGEVTVTSVPDIAFPVEADGRTWAASFNPMTGAVTGAAADTTPPTELGWRRFLLRLHTAHGYPGDPNARWYWAVVVDAMAFTLCFWGLSGLVMWWQIKATRRAGAVILALSTAAATALGFAMHAAMVG